MKYRDINTDLLEDNGVNHPRVWAVDIGYINKIDHEITRHYVIAPTLRDAIEAAEEWSYDENETEYMATIRAELIGSIPIASANITMR